MAILIFLALIAWFVFGDPANNVADWFWDDAPAPWETVDAFYYPNRSDLTEHREMSGLSTVDACRDWVYHLASLNNDPGLTRGDYECGIGQTGTFGGIKVYRLTAK